MSKRVKKFEDKQRPLTPSERAALDALKSKNAGRVIKNQVLTPEDYKLLEIEEDKPKITKELEGKIITEKDLEKEKKALIDEEEKFQEEYLKQLKIWNKVKDEHKEYDKFTFDGDYYLVRVFCMDVSSFKGYYTAEYEWSSVLRQFKLVDKQLKQNIFPIVKVLKVGIGFNDTPKYDKGDICLVPSDDVIGEDWNPKFLHVMQFQKSNGIKPVLPDGMRQSIPNIELNWSKYKFVRPWVRKPEGIDNLTYLIPQHLLKGKYEI